MGTSRPLLVPGLCLALLASLSGCGRTAVLSELEVAPATQSVSRGATVQLTAIGTYSDGSRRDLSRDVEWLSADAALATIDGAGVATALRPGEVTISASISGRSASSRLTIEGIVLVGLTVEPPFATLAPRTRQSFRAFGTFSDATTEDLTARVTWSSSENATATVSNDPLRPGEAFGQAPGTAQITASLEGVSASASLTITNATLQAITLDPPSPTVARGTYQRFRAVGAFSDGSSQDLTAYAAWSSSDATIAGPVASDRGLVHGEGAGTATVRATLAGKTGSTSLTVVNVELTSLTLVPAAPSLARGTEIQVVATGLFADGTSQDLTEQVTWRSSDAAVATVSNAAGARGLVRGLAPGVATLTAALGAVSSTVPVTVTGASLVALSLSPASESIGLGTEVAFSATGVFSDDTHQDLTALVRWRSSDPAVATISNLEETRGIATGRAAGSVAIVASFGAIEGSTPLFVSPAALAAIHVSPANATLAKGTSQPLAATGRFSDGSTQNLTAQVTWTSSDPTLVFVSGGPDAPGLARGLREGSARVSATLGGVGGSADITVTAAMLTSLAIDPASLTLAKGTTLQLAVTGTFSDGTTQNVTAAASWTSSNAAVAVVSSAAGSRGRLTATGEGTASVTATLQGQSAIASVTGTPATLTSIALSPTAPSVARGTAVAFRAIGTYSDATTQDVTDAATWASSDAAVAPVSNAEGSRGLARALAHGSATISATLHGRTGSTPLTVTPSTLVSIAVTPTNPTLAKGTRQQLTAIGTYSDSTTQDLTASASWSSAAPAVASVSDAVGSKGLASAESTGTATITATVGATSGTTTVTVTAAALESITVSPPSPSIAKGTRQAFVATGIYSDGSSHPLTRQVTWTSSDPAVATVSNATLTAGQAQGVGQGRTTVRASLQGKSGSATLTVTEATLASLDVAPASASLPKGTTLQLRATGVYTDASTQDLTLAVAWSSGSDAVAVSNAPESKGLATGVSVGSSTVTAALGGLTRSVQLTVTAAVLTTIEVTSSPLVLAKGTRQPFAATGIYSDASTKDLTTQAAWSSSAATVATVSNALGEQGVVSAVGEGEARIAAAFDGRTGEATVTVTPAALVAVSVTPASATIAKGTTQPFKATGLYSDSTTQDLTALATWTSSAPAVASVSSATGSSGVASGASVGTTTISAAYGGVSGGASLAVSEAALASITVTPASPSIAKGTSLALSATGVYTDGTTQDLTASCSWSSSAPAVAQVSSTAPGKGVATAVAVGTATITANSGGQSGSTTLTVTPADLVELAVTPVNPSLAKGLTRQFTVTGTWSDASTQDLTRQATWSSSEPAIVSVSNASGTQGLASALAQGSATISATFGGRTATSSVTVTAATLFSISVTPTNPSIAARTTQQFSATGLYTDGSKQDLTSQATWTSASAAVATVSNAAGSKGLAAGVSAGKSVITAAYGGVTGSTTLTVTNATVTAVFVTPTGPSLPAGTTQQFTATGVFSDGSRQDLTAVVSWTSTVPTIATVSSRGLATALATGTTRIRATFGTGLAAPRGSSDLTVTQATLVSIDVTPAGASLAKGTSRQFTATGTYSDNTTRNITALVTWSSSNATVASVSNAAGSEGLVSAVAEGPATVSASFSNCTGTTSLSVSAATLVSVAITPSNSTLAKGSTQRFVATGTYSDLTTQDLTGAVTWFSENLPVATVSNASGSKGLVSGVGVGNAVLGATLAGKTGWAVVSVSPATLVSLSVTPASPIVAQGLKQRFIATGLYSDDTTQDVTAAATWSSSNPSVATVSNAAGSEGEATTLAQGTTLVAASLSGQTGASTLTVTPATLVSIAVTPASTSIAKGTSLAFTATGTYSDGTTQPLTTQASWTSSQPGVASVSNAAGSQGVATGVNQGATQISARFGGTTGSATLTVTAATLLSIALSPADQTLADGTNLALTATGTFSDSSTQDVTALVTWSSSWEAVATVSNAAGTKGVVSAAGPGTATITASLSGKSGTTTVTVSPATLLAIQVTPASASVPVGGTQQFRATGIYSDATQQDLTNLVTWTAQTTTVASVSNAAGSRGLATGLAAGSTVITATSAGQSGSAVLGVTQ